MHTNHVDRQIEAYLDHQLSAEERRQVELHLKQCPACAQRLIDARGLERELGPVLKAALGQPTLPPHLRYTVRQAIQPTPRRSFLSWATPLKVLNALGSVAVVALLAFGALVVIRGQIPGLSSMFITTRQTLAPVTGGGTSEATPVPPTVTAPAEPESESPAAARHSAQDVLPKSAIQQPASGNAPAAGRSAQPAPPALSPQPAAPTPVALPGGTIAYPLFNGQMYQIHLINPDGTNLRTAPMLGVSEPALHPAKNDFALAVRSWNDPDGPRSLVTTDILAERPQSITHFWEDAQPDWSPKENRLIFASQRESDRRWRLYSAWGDGSLEVNLRREGQSPTFAPDGFRFVYQGCDETGNRCGLWRTDIEHSEQQTELILENPLARSPDWSPVSEEIVYMANPNGDWDLYLANSDGSGAHRLTRGLANDGLPVWSPDGQWIAFVSDREGAWGVWILHPKSGQMRRVVAFEQGTLTPPVRAPYTEHGERHWWDEQISWGK
ncbi:MAG: hypothetical protein D6768_03415 [Chloroflexi bacterium]|nr:MAG: hypothetical protein D6768_03415 [Chloroflexota bacterium]